VRTYPTELPILRDLLPEIEIPVQIIAGARDLAVPFRRHMLTSHPHPTTPGAEVHDRAQRDRR
jgi:pimeloyl-ACP methyl ester carboxylesterase